MIIKDYIVTHKDCNYLAIVDENIKNINKIKIIPRYIDKQNLNIVTIESMIFSFLDSEKAQKLFEKYNGIPIFYNKRNCIYKDIDINDDMYSECIAYLKAISNKDALIEYINEPLEDKILKFASSVIYYDDEIQECKYGCLWIDDITSPIYS